MMKYSPELHKLCAPAAYCVLTEAVLNSSSGRCATVVTITNIHLHRVFVQFCALN